MVTTLLPSETLDELKPRLRGWLHAGSFFVSLITGAVLITMAAAEGAAHVAAVSVYAVTVTLLFGVSALYHRRTWSVRGWLRMKRLDHSMIFVFIAGSYTPFAVLALDPGSDVLILTTVWLGAVAGVALKLAWPGSPRWLGVPIYIALGWVAVFVLPQILANAGVTALVLLMVGGLLYSVGGIAYASRWPNPSPVWFGHHEVFHACTVVAAICHYVAIWFVVYSG
ncbi:MAG: hemolysin III family protein [Geodermatophilaceae bacterium]|nr:hemolysin III family protein [Geodermatophilaceae bacterium]